MKNRGQTIIASLVVVAIILVCIVFFMRGTSDTKPTPKADGRGTTTLGNVRASAQDEVCRANLGQARQFLAVAKSTDEESKFTTVAEIPGAKSVSTCPVGKEPYTIDAAGTVHCPYPGHEKF